MQTDDPEVIAFLLSTDILERCLSIMQLGTELSKTVYFTLDFSRFPFSLFPIFPGVAVLQ